MCFFSADQETGPGPGDYDIETSIGKGLSKTIGELPPVDDGCRSYSHNVIQNFQDKNLDICFKNIHACKYTSKLFVLYFRPESTTSECVRNTRFDGQHHGSSHGTRQLETIHS